MILVETIATRLALNENAQSEPGVLATLEGVFAEYDKRNLNDRVYSKRLWERALESADLTRALQGKVLFGEIDHPLDRIEPMTEKSAFCITELHMDESDHTIKGTAKVLDTPAGRILNTLLRFGSMLGMSSRGEGDVDRDGNVNEDTYRFVTFDAVTNPSNVGAHPVLVESVEAKKNLDALLQSIETADEKGLKIIEEAATSFDEETAKIIINKIEDRRSALSEDDKPDEQSPDDDESDIKKILHLLETISEKQDQIIEMLTPEPPVEPEDPVEPELVDTEESVRESRVIARRKRPTNENTRVNPVKQVISAEGLDTSTDEITERVARLVRKNK